MRFGYARVSTDDQNPQAQLDALRGSGCDRIFSEAASGGRWDRPELTRLLEQLRPGDVVVVWKLDRLSRSLKDMLLIIERIDDAQAHFESLTEAVATDSIAGRMLMHMLSTFSEYERSMIRERTRAGLAAARAAGKKIGGSRPKLSPAQRQTAFDLLEAGRSQAEVARLFGVHRSTITRMVQAERGLQAVAAR